MIRAFRCDLHIHTCLSPCADLDMYPSALVRKAVASGLDVIAICDHNASENASAVIRAARGLRLKVFPGMEIASREEVHFLALFESMSLLQKLQEIIYSHLPGQNDEARFGCQAIVNELDEVEGFNDRLLIGATDLPLEELVGHVHSLGGIAVASHIDRESFSVISQLGFLDPLIPFDALEVSRRLGLSDAVEMYRELGKHGFLTSSDAHRIDEIGTAFTDIFMEKPTLRQLRAALAACNGHDIGG